MGYEIDFLSVGNSNGDAICARYGDQYTGYAIHITDGGYTDTGQRIINHIAEHYGNASYISDVVVSHQDGDHVTGLLSVVRHFDIGTLWMNRPWLYAAEIIDQFHGNYTAQGLTNAIRAAYPQLVELESIANAKGIPVREVFAYSQIGRFTVLAPTRKRYLTLIPQFDRTPTSYAKPVKGVLDKLFEAAKALVSFFETWGSEALEEYPAPTSASNECCVIQLGVFEEGRSVLLTADAGPVALAEAADVAATLGRLSPPTLVQVPHHGSRRNVTPSVLNRWLGPVLPEGAQGRGTAVCSVGEGKPQYPRKRVSNAFLRRGYPVVKTGGGGTWISHAYQMPARAGSGPIPAIPFVSYYEE